MRGKKIGERTLTGRFLRDTQPASRCQMAFICASESKRIRSLLDALPGAAILTVGETDDFTALGGMLALQLEGSRVRFQIASDLAENSGLRISSKLLKLAEIVRRQP